MIIGFINFITIIMTDKEYQRLINDIDIVRKDGGLCESHDSMLEKVQSGLRALGFVSESQDVCDFRNITKTMIDTFSRKNHDYGNSFGMSCDRHGIVAAVVRLGDKMNRIESLTSGGAEVKDESIKDTLLDLANYAIMTIMWLNKRQSEQCVTAR